MQVPVSVFGMSFGLGLLGTMAAVAAVPPGPTVQTVTVPLLAQSEIYTLLRFETQHYLVRVFQQKDITYLNIYNKETGFTDLNRVVAYLAPPRDEEDNWRTYVNQAGDLEYRARVSPEGDTELEIRIAGGPPAQPEVGFNATYSFPHMYLGQDIEAILTELEDSGWVVDATADNEVELSRNQRALDLKFDPETGLITYTRLQDLT
jgi:hypothetical protein